MESDARCRYNSKTKHQHTMSSFEEASYFYTAVVSLLIIIYIASHSVLEGI